MPAERSERAVDSRSRFQSFPGSEGTESPYSLDRLFTVSVDKGPLIDEVLTKYYVRDYHEIEVKGNLQAV